MQRTTFILCNWSQHWTQKFQVSSLCTADSDATNTVWRVETGFVTSQWFTFKIQHKYKRRSSNRKIGEVKWIKFGWNWIVGIQDTLNFVKLKNFSLINLSTQSFLTLIEAISRVHNHIQAFSPVLLCSLITRIFDDKTWSYCENYE